MTYRIDPCLALRLLPGDKTGSSVISPLIDQHSPKYPFVVRSRRPGDAIRTAGGGKAVGKLFGEWGVPEQLRWMLPVVEQRGELVAVLGRAFGFHDEVAVNAKAMFDVMPFVVHYEPTGDTE